MSLSKSLYIRGRQCEKSLWLKKYNPDVLQKPDEQAKAVFERGNEVGDLACELFPGGKEIPYEGTTFEEKTALTKQWIEEGVTEIFEATFTFDDVLVMVDILQIMPDGSVNIYEVKSSSWSSKKGLNDIAHYMEDASIQYYVLEGLGYRVNKCYITMLNSEYVCDGSLDITQLFTHVDVTDAVKELQEDIPAYLSAFQTVLADEKHEPEKPLGRHCFKPYTCDAYEYCWKKQAHIPDFSVFDIFNMGPKPLALYKQGIVEVEDIPENALTTDNQRQVVESWKNRTVHVDRGQIETFLKGLRYPVYHLDFETYMDAVPRFKNQRPYQQMCSQYSIHIEHEDGRVEHREFLGKEGTDTREPLIKQLIADISLGACVMVFNESFEKTRIREMARDFPEYAARLLEINKNMVDLALPFQKKYYYDYRLQGKHSIKKVMPLLAPHMADTYEKLDLVHNGGEAMLIFPKLVEMDEEERERYREALLEYCKLDTLAMVEILKRLREMVG